MVLNLARAGLHEDIFWQIVNEHPELHPHRLANMIYAETNVDIDGQLIAGKHWVYLNEKNGPVGWDPQAIAE
ncbi:MULTISPECIES: hypothetical protein [Prochlorococcus]|uniref:hypothetical protein n=1 Tax=Prochlorococcus TaxID=1218 RepID=UPI0007B3E193|nr:MULTISPECIES: hypothetical protein [Prochlorococcus]NMO83613.1 hypothetical protein [Prochlorococcus sp. P1344]NMP12597.1 hypothetical protein [Prochlorococcus sp.P1363]